MAELKKTIEKIIIKTDKEIDYYKKYLLTYYLTISQREDIDVKIIKLQRKLNNYIEMLYDLVNEEGK